LGLYSNNNTIFCGQRQDKLVDWHTPMYAVYGQVSVRLPSSLTQA